MHQSKIPYKVKRILPVSGELLLEIGRRKKEGNFIKKDIFYCSKTGDKPTTLVNYSTMLRPL